ncbi:MAG: hypothetical protein ACFE8A_14675 [Candidatus Hodarchaeota archaeon]
MEILNKNDITYSINQYDFELINGYLKEVEKRSYQEFRNQKGIILECLNYIDKYIKKITILDVKNYFEKIVDKKYNKRTGKPIKLDTKENYRSRPKKYYINLNYSDDIEFLKENN